MRNNRRSCEAYPDEYESDSSDDADGEVTLHANLKYVQIITLNVIIWNLDADEIMKFDDFDALDKEDVWTWEDGDNVRPEQSRRVVADVIQEGKDGNLSRFHQHFLKGLVVPDKDEGEVSF